VGDNRREQVSPGVGEMTFDAFMMAYFKYVGAALFVTLDGLLVLLFVAFVYFQIQGRKK
jgi:hypothetical protein